MAQYHYDEGGSMAAYFALSFLVLVLVPFTLSFVPSKSSLKNTPIPTCQCPDCLSQRSTLKKKNKRSILKPHLSLKVILIFLGWAAVAGLCYKVMTSSDEGTKVYDPFEILGIRHGTAEKEIKRHYKRLSVKFHPDKVKIAENETMEMIESKFVELTKAYKSLTDETIRKNWEQYGHPDGRQEMSMGIAIPQWMVEGKNTIWVLGVYGLVFGCSLPFLVGKWWFGSRVYTKDGVHAKSAEKFFKTIHENSTIEDTIKALAAVWQYETYSAKNFRGDEELGRLQKEVEKEVGSEWVEKSDGPLVRRPLVLLYAHLLRLPIESSFLRDEQKQLLTHSPTLLTSLLNITLSRNWLSASLNVMHLNAHLAQAVKPSPIQANNLLQFPGLSSKDIKALAADSSLWNASKVELESLVQRLRLQNDARADAVSKAGERWGRLEIVDVYFKVIGERIITPGAHVNLIMKLRIAPPMNPASSSTSNDHSPENEKRDNEFLVSRKDVEDLPPQSSGSGFAHAPRWPLPKRPQWWALLGDDKSGKVIVPPVKIAEVPYSNKDAERNYRTWKIVFQAPNQVGKFSWKIRFVSDTFVGEETSRDIELKLDDPSLLETNDLKEDEISDPEEDTLAGQMAAMRGLKVKKIEEGSGEDDSSTDEEGGDDSSSSDSD